MLSKGGKREGKKKTKTQQRSATLKEKKKGKKGSDVVTTPRRCPGPPLHPAGETSARILTQTLFLVSLSPCKTQDKPRAERGGLVCAWGWRHGQMRVSGVGVNLRKKGSETWGRMTVSVPRQ